MLDTDGVQNYPKDWDFEETRVAGEIGLQIILTTGIYTFSDVMCAFSGSTRGLLRENPYPDERPETT